MASREPTPWPSPTVTLWGAAREVTGSQHLAQAAGQRLLLDCGLVMEKGEEARARNGRFPFDPAHLDAVLLSHAHLDHSGNLPNLVRQGFAGPIWCTKPTRDLLTCLLPDAARIQAEEAERLTWARPAGARPVMPLYGRSDVDALLEQVRLADYGEPIELAPGLTASFHPAGHVIGSAMVHLEWENGAQIHRLTYTADLGRRGLPLHRPSAPLPRSELVLCESTYGGRVHEPWEQMLEALRVLTQTTLARGGKALIPAFSLGRTQLLVYAFQTLMESERLPKLRLFVDSPLAAQITSVYQRSLDDLAEPLRTRFAGRRSEFLMGPGISYLRTQEDSQSLNDYPGPAVILSSSGMGEGGRIIHHLKHWIDDPRCTIILVSFQAPGTLGARLLEPGPTIRIHGKDRNKWADIVALRGFSAHADQADLLAKLGELDPRATRVALVHGEPKEALALAAALRERGWPQVGVGEPGETLPW